MRTVLIGLVAYLLISGCILKRQSEHYASMSKLVTPPTMEMNLRGLKSEPGPNEIFRFRRVSGILFPFMFGTTDLYLEVAPQHLTNNRTIRIPSTGFDAYVCKEIHPGIFCVPAAGQVSILNVSRDWLDFEVSLQAQNTDPRGKFEWSLSQGIAFPRTDHR